MTIKRKSTGIIKNPFRSAYALGDYDFSESFTTNGLTEQYHKDSCDINIILSQFQETGILPPTYEKEVYGDYSELNYQDMQNQLAQAKSLFEQLPEHVKGQFNNDMQSFLTFAENPNNIEALTEMGLTTKNDRIDQALQAEADEKTTSLTADKSDNSDASAELPT